jgi:hypothetical protein
MKEKPIEDLMEELSVSSRFSLGLILVGVAFLVATIIYSATRLRPLEEEVSAKTQESINLQNQIENLQHQIDAKKAELQRVTEAVTRAAYPLPNTADNVEGWLYAFPYTDLDRRVPVAKKPVYFQ